MCEIGPTPMSETRGVLRFFFFCFNPIPGLIPKSLTYWYSQNPNRVTAPNLSIGSHPRHPKLHWSHCLQTPHACPKPSPVTLHLQNTLVSLSESPFLLWFLSGFVVKSFACLVVGSVCDCGKNLPNYLLRFLSGLVG